MIGYLIKENKTSTDMETIFRHIVCQECELAKQETMLEGFKCVPEKAEVHQEASGRVHFTCRCKVLEVPAGTDLIEEWCPYCEAEVLIPATMKQHPCPECGEMLKPCALCRDKNALVMCVVCPVGVKADE